MRPKKKIILHNPKLIKIRKNLRALLDLAYHSELSRLLDLDQKFHMGRYEASDEEIGLTRKIRELSKAYSDSILTLL